MMSDTERPGPTEIEKTSCDFSFRGWADEITEPDRPLKPDRLQCVRIDLKRHLNYLELP